jgi:hypothetical protein
MYSENYLLLIRKLDAFIRKYYKNLLLRGLIYFFTIFLIAYLVVAVLEYYGQFGTTVRAILFFSSLSLAAFVLFQFVLFPLAGFLRIGKMISHDQASSIIGRHFPEVRDKLLNTLQLKDLAEKEPRNSALISASIDQRIEQLKPVSFGKAINLKANYRYLKYLSLPLMAFIIILFTNARIVTDGTRRIVQYNKFFEKEAPFRFELINGPLKALQNEDFTLKVKLLGDEIPREVFLEREGQRYKMVSTGKNVFEYRLRNLQKDFEIQFWADPFYSAAETFRVLPKPALSSFEVRLEYPSYTGRKNETLKNIGDMTLPQGTKATWNFRTRNTDYLNIYFGSSMLPLAAEGKGHYRYARRFLFGDTYYLKAGSKEVDQSDSVIYRVNVIPDAYPLIDVEEKKDSLSSRISYFVGEINDDYGFSKLDFYYSFIKSEAPDAPGREEQRIGIAISGDRTSQQFYYIWDMNDLGLRPGEEIEYYFEVWDNDGVNGAKKVRSRPSVFKVPSVSEIREEVKERSEALKSRMEEAIKESKKLGKDIQELQKRMLEKKTMSWEDKKLMEELLRKQEELRQKIEELKKENLENNSRQNEFTPQQEEIVKKQQELQKLFEELFNDEMKQMMEEMQRLMNENNKDKLKEELEKMQLSEKDLSKQLDRMLELYKKLELENSIKENIDRLNELSEKQEKLAEESGKPESDPKEMQQLQDSLNKAFEELKNDFKELDSLNAEMESPLDLMSPQEEMEDIEKDQQESIEELGKKDKKQAKKKQQQAAKKMEDLARKLDEKMKKEAKEQEEEDYARLREILENLIQLSFDQELLMKELAGTGGYNPRFVELVQKQKKLKDDARLVEDSLLALSKRVMQIRSYINTEIGAINSNLEKSMRSLAERKAGEARVYQQYTMTGLNNLAVMLSEILKNMQDDMMSGGDGNASKSKPKKGNKQDLKKMEELQKQLGDQLKKMKEGLEKGEQPGSAGWAKMAAQQEAIRKMMEQLQKQMQESGNGKESRELQKTIDEMEKIEKDLVNKKLNLETLKRVREIETRMLEHEKADKEREKDEKRESEEGKQPERKMPPSLLEYLRRKEKESEMLKTLPPELQPYFKEKTREYLRNINTP